MSLDQEILDLLSTQPCLTARDIAELLSVDDAVVNSRLYTGLKDQVLQDREYRWSLKRADSVAPDTVSSWAVGPAPGLVLTSNQPSVPTTEVPSSDVPLSMPQTIDRRLESSRKDLLDLGNRNTLISFRELRSRGVEVVDEVPKHVFEILVGKEKAMSFLPVPDAVVGDEDAQWVQPTDEEDLEGPAARHLDDKLQTPYSSSRLQRRLLNTYYAARTHVEERGVNILYVALGMLEWFEADQSEISRRAPLILIPIDIERKNVKSKFTIRYSGDDVGTNLSLQAKCRIEFGIELPDFDTNAEEPVDAYFDAVGKAVKSATSWNVQREAISVGFFSFSKFLMYRDLDPETWPEALKPADHPVLNALLGAGFSDRLPTGHSSEEVSDELSNRLCQVMDADGSQLEAVKLAQEGLDLVIQGPPGTGKSQTISNLLAQALHDGKKVLFVAEKMAALEVVKRRLDGIGLGDACLELHSHKTNKRAVLEELRRTLGLGKPRAKDKAKLLQELKDWQNELHSYCQAVNTAIGESEVTPYDAIGGLLKDRTDLGEVQLPRDKLAFPEDWSGNHLALRIKKVERLQTLLEKTGPLGDHRFYGSQLRAFLLGDRDRAVGDLDLIQQRMNLLEEQGQHLAAVLRLDAPTYPIGVAKLLGIAEAICASPDLREVNVKDPRWLAEKQVIETALENGGRAATIHSQIESDFLSQIWEQDFIPLRQKIAPYVDKWWRFLAKDYRDGKKELAGYARAPIAKGATGLLAIIDQILEFHELRKELKLREGLLAELFGFTSSYDSEVWDSKKKIARFLADVHERAQTGSLDSRVLDCLEASLVREHVAPCLKRAEEALAGYSEALDHLLYEVFLFDQDDEQAKGSWYSQSFSDLRVQLNTWGDRLEDLQDIVTFNHLADELRSVGLGDVLPLAAGWPDASEHLARFVRISWYENLLDRAFTERLPLARFDRDHHDHAVTRFRKVDRLRLEMNRADLALKHWEGLPRHQAGGQLAVLRREFEKKRRHLPLRKLMQDAGNAVQAIKPVFMMSPLSIASFLPPGSVRFDLVIFDEASQVRPVDAFGAILRADQAIVVGDRQQLPPTSFFDKMYEEIEEEVDNVTADLESVLRLMTSQGCTEVMLRWHYRSRHDSLIAVSNCEFYDSKLLIFPSPDHSRKQSGVVFHHLPDARYVPGQGARKNPEEARAVARAVLLHAAGFPHLTLGVAAFSQSQMVEILDQLELLRRKDPTHEAFFDDHIHEPFFVKNLENVQGDERDVIFISVGYGRTAKGYLSMGFGPLNRDGGERRLNVLITRARYRCEVFSNLRSDDIDPERTKSRGAAVLKKYLKFAETGQLEVASPTEREADSLFEEMVAKALRDLGHTVHCQVGTAGFFVDLAVVDQQRPGRYLLGIECDGASYHSSRIARDRDRIRQSVLESLGWRIHRIWSTDWFKHPERELRKVAEAIEKANADTTELSSAPGHSVTAPVVRDPPASADTLDVEEQDLLLAIPYEVSHIRASTGSLELHQVHSARFSDWLISIVQTESPIHIDEATSRIRTSVGLAQAGRRIRKAIMNGVRAAERQGRLVVRGEFLWLPEMGRPPIRDRSALPPQSRKLEYVAREEINETILRFVEASFGTEREQIPQSVCRILGFKRVSEAMRRQVEHQIAALLDAGKLNERGGHLVTL